MGLNDVKIGYKITGGFTIILILAAIIGYIGYSSMSTIVDRVDKADDANRLVKDVLKARQQEKNFELRGYTLHGEDTEHAIQKLDELIEGIHLQIEVTKAKFNSKDNLAQMDNLGKELQVYEDSMAEYERIYNAQQVQLTKMIEQARIAEQETANLRVSQKEELDADLIAGKSIAELRERIGKADDANRLVKYLCKRFSSFYAFDKCEILNIFYQYNLEIIVNPVYL